LVAGHDARGRHHGVVEILWWWVPPALVTLVAMAWVSWLGRARSTAPDRSDAARERFAAAIQRELPAAVTRRATAPRPARERSTGIAVRPSQQPVEGDRSRRTA
jgi:hypothetical protein